MFYKINDLEKSLSRELRSHPILVVTGLIITSFLMHVLWKPVLLYSLNAFAKLQYIIANIGTEETIEDMRAWNELIAKFNSIGEMGFVGEILIILPFVLRICVVALTVMIFGMMIWFAMQTWEVSLDYRIWHKIAYKTVDICKALCKALEMAAFLIAVVALKTFYRVRKMYRKARRAYRRWEREREANRYGPRILKV